MLQTLSPPNLCSAPQKAMAAAGTGSAAEVLFSYSAGTGDRLVELKRPAFKGDEDIGRYLGLPSVVPF